MSYSAESIRNDFPVLSQQRNGKPIIYLDSAATSLKPRIVVDKMNVYYLQKTANIHRGLHYLSEEASREYDASRKATAKFLGANEKELVFTRNATESLNLMAHCLVESNYFKKGDEIVLSQAEHHANLVPWQWVAQKTGAKIRFVGFDSNYLLDMAELESLLSSKTKLVSIAHVHNTTGVINDIEKMGKMAKKVGSLFFVDGCQSIPHFPTDFNGWKNVDAIAFSGHKMMGPTGIGGLLCRKTLLEKWPPFLMGGDMIDEVFFDHATWNDIPMKFEAGTPAIGEAFGLHAAVDYLSKLGLSNLVRHEQELVSYALQELGKIKGVTLIGPNDSKKQSGTVLFDVKKMDCHDVSLALDSFNNVAIRSGFHCAQPFIRSINPKGLSRASFYAYTTKNDIDQLVKGLQHVTKTFG